MTRRSLFFAFRARLIWLVFNDTLAAVSREFVPKPGDLLHLLYLFWIFHLRGQTGGTQAAGPFAFLDRLHRPTHPVGPKTYGNSIMRPTGGLLPSQHSERNNAWQALPRA